MLYSEALRRRQEQYDYAYYAGTFRSAHTLIGNLDVIILTFWILTCSTLTGRTFAASKWTAIVTIAGSSIWNLCFTRSVDIVGSIGLGVKSGLLLIIGINIIILHDSRGLKRLKLAAVTGKPTEAPCTLQVSPKSQLEPKSDFGEHFQGQDIIVWESLPRSLHSRIAWTLDPLSSPRTIHWSWSEKTAPISNSNSDRLLQPRSASLCQNLIRFSVDFILVDFIKRIVIGDAYFLTGDHDYSPTTPFGQYITSALGLYIYRMLVTAGAFFVAIDLLFIVVKIIHINILGREIVGLNASPLMFPPLWGNPLIVLDKGLRGFWGEVWHQLFRHHFCCIADAVATCIHGLVNTSSKTTDCAGVVKTRRQCPITRLIVAFLLSGMLHAFASITLLGPTRPWAPFLFFACQPIGIAIQGVFSRLTTSYMPLWKSKHDWFSSALNLMFTITWLLTTVQLLADDMSSGGLWLLEPLPISLLRGSGLVIKHDNIFWCWARGGAVATPPTRMQLEIS